MSRSAAVLILLLGSCRVHEPAVARTGAPPDRVRATARVVLAEGGDVDQEESVHWTHWRPEPSVRDLWIGPGRVREAQSKYRVETQDQEPRLSAQARVLVYFGTRHRSWEEVDAGTLEKRMLEEIMSRR